MNLLKCKNITYKFKPNFFVGCSILKRSRLSYKINQVDRKLYYAMNNISSTICEDL